MHNQPHTEKTKKLISQKMKGKKNRLGKIGFKLSKQHKEKISKAQKGKIAWNKGKELSEEHRRKLSETMKKKKEKLWNWKGGNSRNCRVKYWTLEYRLWRKSVFERDNYTCQICRKVGGYLEAHHIKSRYKYPKLAFNIDNGITLCKECHNLTKNGRPFKKNHNKS